MPWPLWFRTLCHEIAWNPRTELWTRCTLAAFHNGFDSIGLPVDGLHSTQDGFAWQSPCYAPTRDDILTEFNALRMEQRNAS